MADLALGVSFFIAVQWSEAFEASFFEYGALGSGVGVSICDSVDGVWVDLASSAVSFVIR